MKTFAEIYESMKGKLEYQVEELSLAFTESVLLRMEELEDMTGADLADRMGASKPYVSKLLKGKSNFTLETLVKLARALECRIEPPKLVPLEAASAPAERPAQVLRFMRPPGAPTGVPQREAELRQATNFSPAIVTDHSVLETQNGIDADNPAAAA